MIIRLTVTFCFILSAPNLQMSRSHFILGLSKIFIFNFLKIAVIHLLKSATHIGEWVQYTVTWLHRNTLSSICVTTVTKIYAV